MATFTARYVFDFATRNLASLAGAAAQANMLSKAIMGAGRALTSFGGVAAAAGLGIGAGVALIATDALAAAAKFEDKMAEVRKVVPDMSKAMMRDMGDEVLKLSVKSAVAAEDVADIFASGARMGIRGKDALSQFAETVVKVAAAWDGVSASMAAENLATISGKFFNNLAPLEAQKRMIGVADAINYLAQNTAGVKNNELLKFFQNTGPMAAQFGLSAEQTAAWGAAAMMTGKGSGLEEGTRASMSMQRLMLAATGKLEGPKGKTNLGKAFDTLGMSQKDWGSIVNSNPQEAVLKFFDKMEGMDKLTRTKFLKDFLGDARSARQMNAMTGQLNEYKRALAQVSDEYATRFLNDKKFMDWMEKAYPAQAKLLRENGKALHYGSVDQEFTARLDTFQKQFDRFSNAIRKMKIELATPMLQPLQDLFKGMTDWTERNPGFGKNLLMGGLVASVAAIGAIATSLIGWVFGIQGVWKVLTSLGAVTLKLTLLAVGIAGVMWIYDNWDKLKEIAKDPIQFSVLFPEAPEWIKNAMDMWGKFNNMSPEEKDTSQTNSNYANRARLLGWWNSVTGGDYGDRSDYPDFETRRGNAYKNLDSSAIPQAITVQTNATFDPATVNVTGTVDARGMIQLQGQGQIQAKDRGTSAGEVYGPPRPAQ
jgi:TP901 family phage tail tape measure protein